MVTESSPETRIVLQPLSSNLQDTDKKTNSSQIKLQFESYRLLDC